MSIETKEDIKEMAVQVCTGSSRWISPNRNMAKHIYLGGRALCGKSYKNGWNDVWTGQLSEISCNRCVQVLRTSGKNKNK